MLENGVIVKCEHVFNEGNKMIWSSCGDGKTLKIPQKTREKYMVQLKKIPQCL